jgi:bifunctional non-homologous end joining protein LigD
LDGALSLAEAALKNRIKQFVIDGEAVVLGVDAISDFNVLNSRKHNKDVQLYAFDILALDGDDLRPLPLSMRKAHLARFSRAGLTASSSTPSSRARLAPTSSARPASSASRA